MHSPHSTIWQLSVYEWWISCVDNSPVYSLDAFTTQYHLTTVVYEWWISCVDNSTMYSLDAFTTQYHLDVVKGLRGSQFAY